LLSAAALRDLSGESAGITPEYAAAERVVLAVADRWREHRGVVLHDDPDEEVELSGIDFLRRPRQG
jgi:hypothetical protein